MASETAVALPKATRYCGKATIPANDPFKRTPEGKYSVIGLAPDRKTVRGWASTDGLTSMAKAWEFFHPTELENYEVGTTANRVQFLCIYHQDKGLVREVEIRCPKGITATAQPKAAAKKDKKAPKDADEASNEVPEGSQGTDILDQVKELVS